MTQEEVNDVVRKHGLWLEEKEGGKRAIFVEKSLKRLDFRGANLASAHFYKSDLTGANFCASELSWATFYLSNFQHVNFSYSDLSFTVFEETDLFGVNLKCANLHKAYLKGINLNEAILDYSDLPLWRGSLNVIVDEKIAAQIAYHFCSLNCNSKEFIKLRNSMLNFANKFHLVGENCEKLEPIE
jgi:uncharacterized protein YjbI with pentapeptide repeats